MSPAPKNRRYKLYAHHMQDVGVYLLTGFEAGVSYLIKGKTMSPHYYSDTSRLWVEVSDLADVGVATRIVDQEGYYEDAQGQRYTREERNDLAIKYRRLAFDDPDDDEMLIVLDRDAYSAYTELSNWTCHPDTYKTIANASMLDFEIIEDQFLSGSVFITNFRPLEPSAEARVWRYDRRAAVSDEIRKTFQRLETQHTGNDSSSPNVNGGNSWGNSQHSGWRYLKAWGVYVFDDKVESLVRDNACDVVGTIAVLQECEKADRFMVQGYLERAYRKNFLKEELSAKSLKAVDEALQNLLGRARELQTTAKSKTSRSTIVSGLEKLRLSLFGEKY